MPDLLIHIGNWTTSLLVGLLALAGVAIGLRGISKQIQSNREQQLKEFQDRDSRAKQEEWTKRQSAAAAILAELELQSQLLSQRDLAREIEILCTSIENKDKTISIPQSYNSYKPERVLERSKIQVHYLPPWIASFVVRYLGLLQYTLNSYVSVFENAMAGTGQIDAWSKSEITSFKKNIEVFDLLESRCASLATILRMMVDNPSESTFLKQVQFEKKQHENERARPVEPQ